MQPIITQNIALHRFEIRVGDELIGVNDYTQLGDRMSFTHAEIEPAYGGKGYAKLLVETSLNDARAQGFSVIPYCTYVRKVIAENPATYLDLVPLEFREQFQLPR
jgi:predicted GNAT family acetyltransferase